MRQTRIVVQTLSHTNTHLHTHTHTNYEREKNGKLNKYLNNRTRMCNISCLSEINSNE